MAMVPAVQGGVVASMHASPEQLEAESAPIIDTSSSSEQSMSTNPQGTQDVRVTYNQMSNQLNQMNVVVTDPMVVAMAESQIAQTRNEANQRIAIAQSETQRVAMLADAQVLSTKAQAEQAYDRVKRDAVLETQRVAMLADSHVQSTKANAEKVVEMVKRMQK